MNDRTASEYEKAIQEWRAKYDDSLDRRGTILDLAEDFLAQNESFRKRIQELEAEVVVLKVAIKDWRESAEIDRAEVKEAQTEAAELRCRLDDAERDSGLIRAADVKCGPEGSEGVAKALVDQIKAAGGGPPGSIAAEILEEAREAEDKDVATFHVEMDPEEEPRI